MPKMLRLLWTPALLAAPAAPVAAAFAENFEVDPTAFWTVNGGASDETATFGIGTAGDVTQWPGGTQDSVWFGAVADGNSSIDWRAYSTDQPLGYPDGSPVYAAGAEAGNRNQSHPYWRGSAAR